jgi:hypothetical protein
MTRTALLFAIGAWTFILAFAILNGALREAVLVPRFGPPWAQVTSGVLLSACVFAVAWYFTTKFSSLSARRLVAVGGLWLVMTLTFEFGFGRLVQGKPWEEIWAAYTFKDGNIWPIVLLVVLGSPWLVSRLKAQP